jgi:hypothetical protein
MKQPTRLLEKKKTPSVDRVLLCDAMRSTSPQGLKVLVKDDYSTGFEDNDLYSTGAGRLFDGSVHNRRMPTTSKHS